MNRLKITKKHIDLFIVLVYLLIFQGYQKKLGADGADYLLVAVLMIAFFFTLFWGSLADTLGKLLKVRKMKEQYKNVSAMKKETLLFTGITSALICGILYACSGWLAGTLLHLDVALRAIRLLIPVFFLRSISAVAEGYFLGDGFLLPVILSSALRPLCILLIVNQCYRKFYAHGQKVSALLRQEQYAVIHGGAGLALGITISEGMIAVLLLVSYLVLHKLKGKQPEGLRSREGLGDHMRLLIRKMIPGNLTALAHILPFVVGSVLLHGLYPEDNAALFCNYFGGYMVPCLFVTALLGYFVQQIGSSSYSCLKREEKRFAGIGFMSGIHFIIFAGGFLAVLFTVEAKSLTEVLHPDMEYGVEMLTGGSFLIVILLLITFCGYLLRKRKKEMVYSLAEGIGILGFLLSAYTFFCNGVSGSMFLVYAGLLGSGCCAVILLAYTLKFIRVGMETITILVIPVISICICGILFVFLQKVLLPFAGGLGTLMISGVLGFSIHLCLLLFTRNIKESELEFLPGGILLKRLGKLFRIY